MAEVARTAGASIRDLQRRFRAATGVTPKEYSRIRRTRAALEAIMKGEAGWAELAMRRAPASAGVAPRSR